MITYLEGVLLRDADGRMCVVPDASPDTAIRVPATMHPFAARGLGCRYEDLERRADNGARVILTLENDPDASILEIDDIAAVAHEDVAAARSLLSRPLAA